jgi:hypothetical protein
MNTHSRPHTIALHRGLVAVVVDHIAYAWQRLQSAWAVHRTRRAAEDAEHELMRLDPRTLHDIGAPEGLVGQRRWQDEQRDAERLLDRRGW